MAQQNYSGGSSVIKEVVSYVSTNFKEDITLSKLAEHVHVNSTYLSTLFKQEMGIPFTTYLNNIRLSHSEELLRTSYHSITEICLMVGFTSPSYFTKVFKKHYASDRESTACNINKKRLNKRLFFSFIYRSALAQVFQFTAESVCCSQIIAAECLVMPASNLLTFSVRFQIG